MLLVVVYLTFVGCSNQRKKEIAEPLSFLKINYTPWKSGLPTSIPIEIENTATQTDYVNTGLLISYFDDKGRKLGTDRYAQTEIIRAGKKANFEIVVHPHQYPLEATDEVTVRVEWTQPLTKSGLQQ